MGISKHDKQALADLFIHMGVPLMVSMQTVESWSAAQILMRQNGRKTYLNY